MSEMLELLPREDYRGIGRDDPLRFYYLPIFGRMYRRRVELCLAECTGGDSILEVGFGSGLTFLNLSRKYRRICGIDLGCDVDEVREVFDRRGIATELESGNVLDIPFADASFDTVLLISILEHLKPEELSLAFREIRRVLKPGGQVVYGVPVDRPFMMLMFRLLGYDIRQHHFSTEKEVAAAAQELLHEVRRLAMKGTPSVFKVVYEVGHFQRNGQP